jgi:adenosylcobinamide-GDP ribazoletransferase
LKDSRIGTFGAAALVVSIAGRAALLAALGAAGVWALPLIGCAARVGPIWLMAFLPYATPASDAKSRDVARGGPPQAIVAAAWLVATAGAAIAAGFLTAPRAAVLTLAMATVTVVTGVRYWRRIGGVTGDFLGATEQLCELAALAVLAWRA